MSDSDNDNFHDSSGVSSSQEPASSSELVALVKLERQMLLQQIEANQSTIIRSQNLISRLDSLLAKLGSGV
jgi:hypothetical protein